MFWVSLSCISAILLIDLLTEAILLRVWTRQMIWNLGELVLLGFLVLWVRFRGWSWKPAFLMVFATELNVLFNTGPSDVVIMLDILFLVGLAMVQAFMVGRRGMWFILGTGVPALLLIHRPESGVFSESRLMIVAFVIGFAIILSVFTRTLDRLAERSAFQWQALLENRDAIESRDRLKLVNQLVLGLAHNINTPLGNGRMRLSMLTERLSGPDREDAEKTDDELARISSVIQELRGLSVLGSEDEVRILEPEDLAGLICDSLRSQDKRTQCDSILVTGDSVITRPLYLLQTLMILVENADLYGRDDGGQLDVAIEMKRRESDYLVTVRDSGPGIDVQSSEDIFQPYYRMGTSGHGRGMGLSIASQVCRYRLKGGITYDPDRNLFEITLPGETTDRPAFTDTSW